MLRLPVFVADLPGWEPAGFEGASAGDLAYDLEALGVSPDGFERVLRLAQSVTPLETPPALRDVAHNWRVGARRLDAPGGTSGRAIGVYGEWVVLIWRKTESDFGLGGRR